MRGSKVKTLYDIFETAVGRPPSKFEFYRFKKLARPGYIPTAADALRILAIPKPKPRVDAISAPVEKPVFATKRFWLYRFMVWLKSLWKQK